MFCITLHFLISLASQKQKVLELLITFESELLTIMLIGELESRISESYDTALIKVSEVKMK